MPFSRIPWPKKSGRSGSEASDDLVNAASLVPKAQRFTAFWDQDDDDFVDRAEELSSIDHVLMAPGLASLVESVAIPHDHDPRRVSDHFPIVVRCTSAVPPPPTSGPRVRIAELVPNPSGDEDQEEVATLANLGSADVSLVGWKLRDRAQTFWLLSGTVGAGQTMRVERAGQPMAMNNAGGYDRSPRSRRRGRRYAQLRSSRRGRDYHADAVGSAAASSIAGRIAVQLASALQPRDATGCASRCRRSKSYSASGEPPTQARVERIPILRALDDLSPCSHSLVSSH
jgi:hypothetical protein